MAFLSVYFSHTWNRSSQVSPVFAQNLQHGEKGCVFADSDKMAKNQMHQSGAVSNSIKCKQLLAAHFSALIIYTPQKG